MQFNIKMGIPEMYDFWKLLNDKSEKKLLNGFEIKLFKKIIKVLKLLSNNPRHNSLSTHEINILSKRYGMKVWQSYLENKTPGAGRIFWVYGPEKNDITIIGFEPHPEDKKKDGYNKIKLSEIE